MKIDAMNEHEALAERFEENRARLRALAYRMLGAAGLAEDAVQEAWLRLHRTDPRDIENLKGWLTTVVARVCLDMLRARKSRREDPLEETGADPRPLHEAEVQSPEDETLLAESVGLAMLAVLDALPPAERVAFVLHDMFDLSFEEIAPVVGRTPLAARKLASRARQRLQGVSSPPREDRGRERAVIEAFLAASRGGDFAALLTLLDPDVVLRADPVAVRMGALVEVRGAQAVAETFKGRAQVAQAALLGGSVGAVWFAGGVPRVAFAFTIVEGRIKAVDLLADPERLQALNITALQ